MYKGCSYVLRHPRLAIQQAANCACVRSRRETGNEIANGRNTSSYTCPEAQTFFFFDSFRDSTDCRLNVAQGISAFLLFPPPVQRRGPRRGALPQSIDFYVRISALRVPCAVSIRLSVRDRMKSDQVSGSDVSSEREREFQRGR